MEAQRDRWSRQQLDVVGIIKVYPDKWRDPIPASVKIIRDLLVAVDEKHPWHSASDDTGQLPSIARLEEQAHRDWGASKFPYMYEFKLHPPVYLNMSHLFAYHRYLETIANAVLESPVVDYVVFNMTITTLRNEAGRQISRIDSDWMERASVSLFVRAYTSDGEPVPTKAELRRLIGADPSSLIFEPTTVLPDERTAVFPSEREDQIKIVGKPIDSFVTGRFGLDELPIGLVLHVQGPDFYSVHGRRNYGCIIRRSARGRLRAS